MIQESYRFDKPVIVLATPRSGSTLLFELLSKSKNTWTIGDESHEVLESIAKFNPNSGLCNSNRLNAEDASKIIIKTIRQRFYNQLRNREGQRYDNAFDKPRFLEKTPKNSLRIPFLNKIFPDAFYIFLYRNPRDNISSMMDAWKSQHFVMYPYLAGRNSAWSLLLPPGWEKMNDKSLEETTFFQWDTTNSMILDDLQALIPKERWAVVSYSELINNTEDTIKGLCDFSGLTFDSVLQKTCRGKLKMSMYTLTAPSPTKWHKYANELSRVLPLTEHTLRRLRQITPNPRDEDFDIHIPGNLCKPHKTDKIETAAKNENIEAIGRNSPCPCGSSLKYKQCHGKLKS